MAYNRNTARVDLYSMTLGEKTAEEFPGAKPEKISEAVADVVKRDFSDEVIKERIIEAKADLGVTIEKIKLSPEEDNKMLAKMQDKIVDEVAKQDLADPQAFQKAILAAVMKSEEIQALLNQTKAAVPQSTIGQDFQLPEGKPMDKPISSQTQDSSSDFSAKQPMNVSMEKDKSVETVVSSQSSPSEPLINAKETKSKKKNKQQRGGKSRKDFANKQSQASLKLEQPSVTVVSRPSTQASISSPATTSQISLGKRALSVAQRLQSAERKRVPRLVAHVQASQSSYMKEGYQNKGMFSHLTLGQSAELTRSGRALKSTLISQTHQHSDIPVTGSSQSASSTSVLISTPEQQNQESNWMLTGLPSE